jgi:hypothetical protein
MNVESVSPAPARCVARLIYSPYTTPTGFSITPEALSNAVSEYVNSSAITGWANMGAAITALRNTSTLRWANPLEVKNAVESALVDRFGAKETAKPKGKVRLAPLPAPYTC